MKIGILTFHWGTNYGAVLQSYALQKFLQLHGYEVEIINYAPRSFRDSFFRCFDFRHPRTMIENLKSFYKERNVAKFRKQYLRLSQRYYRQEQLVSDPPAMDVYIVGSDQVWNPTGLRNNQVYLLPFGDANKRRIAYAASFGFSNYPQKQLEQIKPFLLKIDKISVRENSGLQNLERIGIKDGVLMPDPTLLLTKKEYNAIVEERISVSNYDFFFYVLQKRQKRINEIYGKLKRQKNTLVAHSNHGPFATMGVEDWLGLVKNSKFVVTNSFHGVLFCLIFNKPFCAVPVEGNLSEMNDRIYTVLRRFGLLERIIMSSSDEEFTKILNRKIDWNYINKLRAEWADDAKEFLTRNI